MKSFCTFRLIGSFILMVTSSNLAFATGWHKSDKRKTKPNENVILVTFDGVRWQEFFNNFPSTELAPRDQRQIFPLFWGKFASQGVVYGAPGTQSVVTVANPVNISLPAYESIMSGAFQTYCTTNTCGRIRVETMQERMVRELNLDSRAVVSVSSWDRIQDAVEHFPGSATVNSGITPFPNPERDINVEAMNYRQAKDKPIWNDARRDTYTFDQAYHYLVNHHPRFMYMSFNDSDEWAHAGRYEEYLQTLRTFDNWIAVLVNFLERSGEYGKNTTLIITTDHGRGYDGNWRNHGPEVPEANRIWLYAMGPHARKAGILRDGGRHTHLDIRPTVEALLGLCPLKCQGCGNPLAEVLEVNRPKIARCEY